MYATTTKQLMDQSKCFRLLFQGSIFFISIGVILCIIYPFTSCYQQSYYSCYYSPYYYQCYTYGASYSCSSNYISCGDSYCIPRSKYQIHTDCAGFIISGGSLIGVGFFLAFFVFIMFCHFRSKIRNGAYLGMPQPVQPFAYQEANNVNYAPSPVIVYSDQHSNQTPNQVNLSENS